MNRRALSLLLVVSAAAAACNRPATVDSGASGSPTPVDSATPTPSGTPNTALCNTTGTTTGSGGSLDCLAFSIVGDTRPATIDDTAGYPTSIVTKIYQDIQAQAGRPSFVVATGDYQYSSTTGSQAAAQLDKYRTAAANYSGNVFFAMGNHECTGYTDSNCVTGIANNNNYNSFMSKMNQPLGIAKPYYALNFTANDGSWTAKFVFIAANAWDQTQANWLTSTMQQPTTYTFVVRHEGIYANTAPGVTPSQNIINSYPYTMLLEGHTHTLSYYASDREVIVGIGGAPITGSANYGYVTVRQRGDGAIDFTAYDYQSGAVMKHFVVTKDGGQTS